MDSGTDDRTPKWLTLAAVVVGIIRPIMVWDDLPPILATHFQADGTPDGMSARFEFFVSYGLIMGLVLLSLIGSVVLMDRIPVKYLNLPHKDYWLKSGRLPEARAKMSLAMWWMSAATMLLSTATLELVLRSNLTRTPLEGGLMWTVMGAYSLFTLVWVGKLLLGFSPPDDVK